MMLKPYGEPDQPGRFQFARSAKTWLPDIEAYLVEQEMSTDLAPTVAGLIDVTGQSLEAAVSAIRSLMNAYGTPQPD